MKRVSGLLFLVVVLTGCRLPFTSGGTAPGEIKKTVEVIYAPVRGVAHFGDYVIYSAVFQKESVVFKGHTYYEEPEKIGCELYSPSGKRLWEKEAGIDKEGNFRLKVDLSTKKEPGIYMLIVKHIGRDQLYFDFEKRLWLYDKCFRYLD